MLEEPKRISDVLLFSVCENKKGAIFLTTQGLD